MNASKQIKGLLAGVATVALIGTAIAQGTPPNPTKSAPIGAGQQSSQGTPMGTTGTPGGSGTATGSTSGSTAAGSGSTGSSANMGSTSTSGTTSGSTSMGSGRTAADTSTAAGTNRPVRTARADRN